MLPGPGRMRRSTLPRALLQMRFRQAFSAIIVLRRAALAVVRSHPSCGLPSLSPIFVPRDVSPLFDPCIHNNNNNDSPDWNYRFDFFSQCVRVCVFTFREQ